MISTASRWHLPEFETARALRSPAFSTMIGVKKGDFMPNYLLQVAYTPETWAALIAHPHDRVDAVRPVIEKLGGKMMQGWFAFGDYDVVAIVDMPTNVDAAAFSLAAAAGGAVKSIKTTPLMTAAEGIEAMKKAAKSGYKAPTRTAHA
jgi:uncharacterized protein with GYD domain